jgi:hypothetical protein
MPGAEVPAHWRFYRRCSLVLQNGNHGRHIEWRPWFQHPSLRGETALNHRASARDQAIQYHDDCQDEQNVDKPPRNRKHQETQ